MGEVTLAFFRRTERMCISSATRDGVPVLVASCLSFYSCPDSFVVSMVYLSAFINHCKHFLQ